MKSYTMLRDDAIYGVERKKGDTVMLHPRQAQFYLASGVLELTKTTKEKKGAKS